MIPRIIWMYWDENQTPLIKAILRHNQTVLHNWEIRMLNKRTIHRYIKEFPKEYHAITVKQQSDWLRLYLIMTYGGIWSDASIIYNDASKVEELWKKSNEYDYIGFFNKSNPKYTVIETWFFGSEKNGQFVTLWYREYLKAMKEGFLKYIHRIVEEGTHLTLYNVKDTYFIVYMCLQNILQKPHKKIPMLLLDAFDSMFYLNKKCNWKPNCVMHTIKTKKYVKKMPFIKLTGKQRRSKINILSYFDPKTRKNK
jgi:hypothetical protein